MQFIDKDGNRHNIPFYNVQPTLSPDPDNALYESPNGLKVRGGGKSDVVVRDITERTEDTILVVDNPVLHAPIPHATTHQYGLVKLSADHDNQIKLGTDEGIKVGSPAAKVCYLTGNSGTLHPISLPILKEDIRNVIDRNGIIYNRTSKLDDGKMRFTAVNRYTDGLDYYYTILVDAETGDWTFEYKRMYLCKYDNVPPTTVPNPSGVSGPFFYSIVNDIIHIQWDGVSVSSAGTIYLWNQFPSKYLPKQGKQRCTPAIDFSGGYTNAFVYVNPSGVRMKAWRAGTAYWGEIMYHLDF